MNPNSNSNNNDKSNNNGGREGEPELDADGLPVDPKLRTTHQNRIRKQNQRANEKAVRQYKADQVTKAKLKKELGYEHDEEILAGKLAEVNLERAQLQAASEKRQIAEAKRKDKLEKMKRKQNTSLLVLQEMAKRTQVHADNASAMKTMAETAKVQAETFQEDCGVANRAAKILMEDSSEDEIEDGGDYASEHGGDEHYPGDDHFASEHGGSCGYQKE